MSYALLDNDELLRLALDAVNQDRHAEAMILLKELLLRDPEHTYGNYLLAAEHAQLGMLDAARQGFEKTVGLAPEFAIARFQLGQLCLTLGDALGAQTALLPLAESQESSALNSYAKALVAAAQDRLDEAVHWIQAGLTESQEIPVLANDMRRLLENLQVSVQAVPTGTEAAPTAMTSLYLKRYSQPDG